MSRKRCGLLLLVLLSPSIVLGFTAATLRDDFNRANENLTANPNWSQQVISTETGVLSISGSQVTTTGLGSAWWDQATFGADTWVSAALPDATTTTGLLVGLFLRVANPGQAALTDGYICTYFPGNNPITIRLERIDNSARTTINSMTLTAGTLIDGSLIGCGMEGSTLAAYYNIGAGWVSAVSFSDTTYAAAGYTGMWAHTSTLRLDNFGACTVSGGACLTGAAPDFFSRRRLSQWRTVLCEYGLWCVGSASLR